MRFLLSNDDGYQAPGIRILAKHLATRGELTVIAPETNHSGASNSLTLRKPLSIQQDEHGYYYVNGTPTDCVHLAMTGDFSPKPDMVVSGINAGANLGDDVLYSGTVAAAMEGRFLGCPAIAVSLIGQQNKYIETAAMVTLALIDRLLANPLNERLLLNVNVPDLPYEKLQGYKVTRLGYRHCSVPARRETDANGRQQYWIGPSGEAQDAGPGTDFHAVDAGYVSITPLHADMTCHRMLDDITTLCAEML